MKNIKTRDQLFETKYKLTYNELPSVNDDLARIKPYLEAANKSDTVADIMDSPVKDPAAYEGDIYFTVEYKNGKYDMVTARDGKVFVERDIEAPLGSRTNPTKSPRKSTDGTARTLEEFKKMLSYQKVPKTKRKMTQEDWDDRDEQDAVDREMYG